MISIEKLNIISEFHSNFDRIPIDGKISLRSMEVFSGSMKLYRFERNGRPMGARSRSKDGSAAIVGGGSVVFGRHFVGPIGADGFFCFSATVDPSGAGQEGR